VLVDVTDSRCRWKVVLNNCQHGATVKLSHYRAGQTLRFPRGWSSQISIRTAHGGGKVVSPAHRPPYPSKSIHGRLRLKCDGTRAKTRFGLSPKRTSPFKSAGASVQSTACSQDVRISGSNAGYTIFRGSEKGAGYPLHSPVSPTLSPPVRQRVPSHFNSTVLMIEA
jgi:hypothetical protein